MQITEDTASVFKCHQPKRGGSLRPRCVACVTDPSLVFKDAVPDQVCAFELILALLLAARRPAGRLPGLQKVRQERVRTAFVRPGRAPAGSGARALFVDS